MKLFITILTFVLALPVMAQTDELRDLPGYVDFGKLNAAYGEPKVQINLGESMLGFVRALAHDEEVADVLGGLKAVRVHVYRLDGSAEEAISHIEDVSAKLKQDNWEPIISVKDQGEKIQVFIKMTDGVVDGLTMMAAEDGGEAVFINIIGELDPEQLSKVTDALDLDLGID